MYGKGNRKAETELFKERKDRKGEHGFALFRYLRGQHTEGGRHGMGKREDMYGVVHSVRVRKERKERAYNCMGIEER